MNAFSGSSFPPDPLFALFREGLPEAWPILIGRSGSHSYGTSTPDSDEDYKGVYLLSFPARYRVKPSSDTFALPSETSIDASFYELRKFLSLAVKCNPNILELLYLDEEDIVHACPLGRALRGNRDMFLSKRAFASYAGYAESQLKRLQGYRNNSEARRHLRDTFGYDTKFGMHLIRLLRMLNEILIEGTLTVARPDAENLLEIRNGAWTFEFLTAEAEKLKTSAEKALLTSSLPELPNYESIDALCARLYRNFDAACFSLRSE